jgi:outer membrane protein TolC
MKYIKFIALIFVCVFFPFSYAYAEETLSWKACIEEAKNNNPELISAVQGVEEKKADKSITASAFYPQITSSVSGSRTNTTTNSNGNTAVKDSYAYGLSGTQLVFDGLKTLNDTFAAKENIKVSQESYRYTSSSVRLNLRTAFVNLLKAQESIRVSEEIFKIRRDNLILITLRYKAGLEHKGALLTAEANLAQADFDLAHSKRNIEFYQRQLTKELGRKEFKPFMVTGDFTVVDSSKDKPDLEELAKKNPSFLQVVAKKNSTSFAIKSAYAGFVPELNGSAGTSKTGSA